MTLVGSVALAVLSAFGGALIKHVFDRRAESQKRNQELKAAAYVDFLRAVAGLAQERTQKDLAMVADAKARIVIYGSKPVVEELSRFLTGGGSLVSADGRDAFCAVVDVMRKEAGHGDLSREVVENLLFGPRATH